MHQVTQTYRTEGSRMLYVLNVQEVKSMKKKMLSVLLCAAMTTAMLAGCGGDNNTKENQSGESQNTGSQDDTQNADNQTAGGEGVFKIGGIGPITGNNAVYGQAVQNAMQIAIDEIN